MTPVRYALKVRTEITGPLVNIRLATAHASDPVVCGNALLSVGHLARWFEEIPRDSVYDLVVRGLTVVTRMCVDKQMR
jgi:hypothetical protein